MEVLWPIMERERERERVKHKIQKEVGKGAEKPIKSESRNNRREK